MQHLINGVMAATNDVALVTLPKGNHLAIAAIETLEAIANILKPTKAVTNQISRPLLD